MTRSAAFTAWLRRRRHRALTNQDIELTFRFGTMLYDGLEQTTGSIGTEWAGQYPSFPGITIADNGNYVMCYRRSSGHAPDYDNSSIRANVSTNSGRSWLNRTNEIVVSPDNLIADPYTSPVANINGRLVCTYEEDYQNPNPPDPYERLCFAQISDDNGATWGAQIPLPVIGTQYTSACGKVVQPYPDSAPNTVIGPIYWRDLGSARYSTGCYRSTDMDQATPTFEFLSVIAQDPSGPTNRQFEETNFVYMGTEGHVGALIRVDDTTGPGSGDFSINAMIYWSETFDGGETWSPIVEAFPGCGFPAVIRLTNGTLVACTRNLPAPTPRPGVPSMWILPPGGNPNRGWQGPHEFGDTSLVVDGTGLVGFYMYCDLIEPSPNVVGIAFGQDRSQNIQGLAYVEYGVGVQPESTYVSARSLYIPLNPSSTYLTYNTWDGLAGASRFVMQAWARRRNNAGAMGWISRRISGSNQMLYMYSTTEALTVGLYSGSTGSFWNGTAGGVGTGDLQPDLWNHVLVVYDGTLTGNANRLQVYLNGALRTPASYTGTVPAALNTGVTAGWAVGSITTGAGASYLRNVWLDDIVIWRPSATIADPAALAVELYGGGPANPLTTSLGAPLVWLGFETADFADAMGNLGAGTLTTSAGGTVERTNIWVPGPGYLSGT